ncbi:uncharacterized protein LOC144442557 [Glandiceps talaboti]
MLQYISIVCLFLVGFGQHSHARPWFTAFSVARETPFGPLPEPTALPFEVEYTNINGCFDLATGIFTAPYSGHYHFNYNMYKSKENSMGPKAKLVVKSDMKVPADDQFDTASNSLVYPMKAGDQFDTVSNSLVYPMKAGDQLDTASNSLVYPMKAGDQTWDTASNSLVHPMKAGDQAWLHFAENREVSASELHETTFHGFLISEEEFEE